MRILDITAGRRAIWFNQSNPLVTFLDVRPEVSPDIVADARELAPRGIVGPYDLIVFDPPHKNNGAAGGMTAQYGHFTIAEIADFIRRASREVRRVARTDALMSFKWNDHNKPLVWALDLMPDWEPLVGHGVRPQQRGKSITYWALLRAR